MKRCYLHYLLCSCLICFFLIVGERFVWATEFTVEGILQSTTHIPLPTNISATVTSRFRVSVADCKWFIRIERPQQNVKSIIVEAGSDGNRIYSVSYIQKNEKEDLVPRAGCVRPGPVPRVMEEPLVSILWLAYASQCYFQTATNAELAPLFTPSDQPLHNFTYTLPAKWTIGEGEHSLPENVIYFDDGLIRYWREERHSWFSPPLTKRAKAPYENGRTNLIYVGKEWKQLGMMKLPVLFELSSFGRKSKAQSSNDLFLATEFQGRATNVLDRSILSSFIPELPKNVRIREERFINDLYPVHTFFYGSSEGKWLADSEVKELREYRAQAALEKRVTPRLAVHQKSSDNKWSRTTIRAATWAMIVSISIGVAILGWYLSKTTTKEKESR